MSPCIESQSRSEKVTEFSLFSPFARFFYQVFVVVWAVFGGDPLRQGFWGRLCFDGFSGGCRVLLTLLRIAKVSDFFVGIRLGRGVGQLGLGFWKDGGVLNMGVGFRS